MSSHLPQPAQQGGYYQGYRDNDGRAGRMDFYNEWGSTGKTSRRGSDASGRKRFSGGNFEHLAGFGLGFGNILAWNVLSHPCIVLRRQCQVNPNPKFAHVTPFSLVPVACNVIQNQGFACLWKGVSGEIIYRGTAAALDYGLSDITGLPRITFTATTTLAATSLIKTVQNAVYLERPGALELYQSAWARLRDDIMGPWDTRRVPVWVLVGPTVCYRMSHYVLSGMGHGLLLNVFKRQMESRKPREARTVFDEFFPDLFASFASHLLTDAILYPVETILHRLYVQGTRTITDDLLDGVQVTPIHTAYEGFFDAARSIYEGEGVWGFYKGFGALACQFLLHLAVLRLTRLIFDQLEDKFTDRDAGGGPQAGPRPSNSGSRPPQAHAASPYLDWAADRLASAGFQDMSVRGAFSG